MISDIFTAMIVGLMAVLVLYPASRALWQSWQDWHRRQNQQKVRIPRR
jgi:hypothetical protein